MIKKHSSTPVLVGFGIKSKSDVKSLSKMTLTNGVIIGSALIRYIINKTNYRVVNIDKLTYAGNLESLFTIKNNSRYSFKKTDICNSIKIKKISASI